MTAAVLSFAFVFSGWLTFVAAVVIASNPKEFTDAAS